MTCRVGVTWHGAGFCGGGDFDYPPRAFSVVAVFLPLGVNTRSVGRPLCCVNVHSLKIPSLSVSWFLHYSSFPVMVIKWFSAISISPTLTSEC